MSRFSDLGLIAPLIRATEEQGYQTPTEIQSNVIPLVLEGRDVMAQAQTGSGKSASFILPILHKLEHTKQEGKPKIKALILTPTRELTLQLSEMIASFGTHLAPKPKVVSIIGGESIGDQLYKVQQGCDIVVATTGRLLDVLSKKQMNLSRLEFLVLDEADRMLSEGFTAELDAILEAIPSKRQNLLFSATYPERVLELSARITTTAQRVNIEEALIVESIKQRAIEVNQENRSALLKHLLKEENLGQTIVFMATKRATENITRKYLRAGINAESFHGDLTQEERNETLKAFREGDIDLLFTTDLVARGLDILDISCVINYDLPRSPANYIHRIGRTGRAGKSGLAISFITLEGDEHFKLIEKRAKIRLEREQINGFERVGEVVKPTKGAPPIKGKRKSKKDKLREKAAQESAQKEEK
jgi:superfamily II DNA/RNA helicase